MTTLINPNLKNFFDATPGCWGCKDSTSTFQYANAEYAKIMGLSHHLDTIGRTDFDMPCKTASYAEIFREQDQSVIVSKKTLQTLDIHPFADGQWHIYLFTKKLWLSKRSDTDTSALYQDDYDVSDTPTTILGTIFHGLDITHTHSDLLRSTLAKWTGHTQNSYVLATTYQKDIKLSKRESEVLFLTLHRKTAKSIAQALTLSPRTIEQYVEQIKYKFDANNKAELIEKAIAQGYLNTIPRSLFSTQLSIILSAF